MNLLSVDFEHPERAASWKPGRASESGSPALERGLRATLELLQRLGARATFFVTGAVAREAPELVQEIGRRGHEIGCHGMHHVPIDLLDREGFRRDTGEALDALSHAGASRVPGFRAPWWSIPGEDHWALAELEALGFRYDSSVFPVRTTHYGSDRAARHPHRLAGRTLWEVPPSAAAFGPFRVPLPGGFYCRAYPLALSRWLLGRADGAVHLYFHPWELLADGPAHGESRVERWIHRLGRRGMARKLERLLEGRAWVPLSSALAETA